jgi:hypothetical protein
MINMSKILKIIRKDKVAFDKFNFVSEQAKETLNKLKDNSVVYLLIDIEIPFKMSILQAEEMTPEVFDKLLRYGSDIDDKISCR